MLPPLLYLHQLVCLGNRVDDTSSVAVVMLISELELGKV
jgi:hypothetical protein